MVANLLNTRKISVILVNEEAEQPVTLTPYEVLDGIEIEEKIVQHLTEKHSRFINDEQV